MTDEVRTTYAGAAKNADVVALADSSLVTTAGSRVVGPIKSASPIANSASTYVAGRSIGTTTTIATGLPAGTVLYSGSLRLKALFADCTTPLAILFSFFDALPTATTDATVPAYTSTDLAKNMGFASSTPVTGYAGLYATWTIAVPRMTVDANGNIYFSTIANGASVFATANSLLWDFSGLY